MPIIIEETQLICTKNGTNSDESEVHNAACDSNHYDSIVDTIIPTLTYGDYVHFSGRI
ncbi:hypothetical protein I2483_12110 [Sporosarcina sp. E16_3]|uniref:hypothetical protein n=1 Tax=Sporosarcina sp. E16_3 TaxID=2789293 RepID=UPI001A9370E1|nr:hypothetical protein [Sporosarcina sp. E16_3]MBO0602403.1 hypothetical protein [Sporosarcina sp. E16_3]